MKTLPLITVAVLIAGVCYAQPLTPPQPPMTPPQRRTLSSEPNAAAPDKPAVNYLVRVDWLQPKGESKFLEVLTTEGSFNVNTIQKNTVKINNSDIPVTLKLDGSLTAINDEKGKLQLYLGRTVPYVTSNKSDGTSTWSQMSAGLTSHIIVTYGKPVIIQNDENGQISVLVRRVAD